MVEYFEYQKAHDWLHQHNFTAICCWIIKLLSFTRAGVVPHADWSIDPFGHSMAIMMISLCVYQSFGKKIDWMEASGAHSPCFRALLELEIVSGQTS